MYKTSGIKEGYIIYVWQGEHNPTQADVEKLNKSALGKIDIDKSTETKMYLKLNKSESPMFLQKTKRSRK
jgi:hypothetical protein